MLKEYKSILAITALAIVISLWIEKLFRWNRYSQIAVTSWGWMMTMQRL